MKYLLRKSAKAKHIRITVRNEQVILTIPKNVKEEIGLNFLKEKKDWVLQKLQKKDLKVAIRISKKDYLENKKMAEKLVLEKINFFNKFYNFEFKKITIKNQKGRWGSCSSNLNLNFNYALIYLEESLQDYIIVHELCHLKEMNHSRNFWHLVVLQIPDYLKRKKALREIKIIDS